jgi:hypothetical protein
MHLRLQAAGHREARSVVHVLLVKSLACVVLCGMRHAITSTLQRQL